MRRLLEGVAYSDLSVNSMAFIRGQRLFEALRLLEKYGISVFISMVAFV